MEDDEEEAAGELGERHIKTFRETQIKCGLTVGECGVHLCRQEFMKQTSPPNDRQLGISLSYFTGTRRAVYTECLSLHTQELYYVSHHLLVTTMERDRARSPIRLPPEQHGSI